MHFDKKKELKILLKIEVYNRQWAQNIIEISIEVRYVDVLLCYSWENSESGFYHQASVFFAFNFVDCRLLRITSIFVITFSRFQEWNVSEIIPKKNELKIWNAAEINTPLMPYPTVTVSIVLKINTLKNEIQKGVSFETKEQWQRPNLIITPFYHTNKITAALCFFHEL